MSRVEFDRQPRNVLPSDKFCRIRPIRDGHETRLRSTTQQGRPRRAAKEWLANSKLGGLAGANLPLAITCTGKVMEDVAKFVLDHLGQVLTYSIELLVLVIILKELRELKRHARALARHEDTLEKVRPLLSTLYTSTDEIFQLAIDFTRNAKQVRAVGTIAVLDETEIRHGESEARWLERLETVPPAHREYASATLDFIHSGREYARVLNLSPVASTRPELLHEVWANVRFFIRAMEDAGARHLRLRLYHDPGLVSGREDFHYRVSDKSVVIRVGGPSRAKTNAAIAISDTRVIQAFTEAYEASLERPQCRELSLDCLRRIDECLATRDLQGLEVVLEEGRQ